MPFHDNYLYCRGGRIGEIMRKFDTKVQHLKYKVLREVARLAWDDKLLENVMDIPKNIVPGNQPTMRCCVY